MGCNGEKQDGGEGRTQPDPQHHSHIGHRVTNLQFLQLSHACFRKIAETLTIVAHGSHLAHLIQKLLGEQTCYKISLELITSHGAWMQGIVCT